MILYEFILNGSFFKEDKKMLSFHLFRHYFLSFKSDSLIRIVAWVCLAGLSVSVAALVLVLSIMDGFGQSIKFRLLKKEAHLILHSKGADKKKDFSQNKESIYSLLPSHLKEGIENLTFFETQDILLKTHKGFFGIIAKGYKIEKIKELLIQAKKAEWEHLHRTENISVVSKDVTAGARKDTVSLLPEETNTENTLSLPLIINESLSSALNIYKEDEALVTPVASLLLPPSEAPPLKRVSIQGVVEESGENNSEEKFSVFYEKGKMDFKFLSNLHSAWEVTLKDPERYKQYLPYFKDYRTEHWVERNSSLLFALKMEKFIMVLFITLAILISLLGISMALFLLIIQKRKDIGILQAMGLSDEEVTKIFSKVGMELAFIGIIGGMLIGLALTAFFKYSEWNILPAMYYDRTLPANFLPFQYVLIFIGSLFVAFLACYLPTLHLSRMSPSDLLKTAGR